MNNTNGLTINESVTDGLTLSPWQRNILIGTYCVDSLQNFTAFLGNLLIILAVLKFKKLQTNAHYSILNLAVTDCLASCVTPVEAAHFSWLIKYGDQNKKFSLCYLQSWIIFFGSFQNLICMALIATDRWISVEYPIFHRGKITKRVSCCLIFISWICGLLITSVSVFPMKTCPFHDSKMSTPLVSIVSLLLTVTGFCYGRMVTITLRTNVARRQDIRFRLAKMMG